MEHKAPVKAIALLVTISLAFSGCANTIPSRADNAVRLHPNAVYPIRVFMFPFIDKRPPEQKTAAEKISWPGTLGRVDFYGENVENTLTDALADYLTASRVFNQVHEIDMVTSESLLKQKGYRALLTGEIEEFQTSFTVPKWVLILTMLPIPTFGLTFIWPKAMEFNAVLNNVRLKDIETNQIIWTGKVEVHKTLTETTYHCSPKWFLGETGELLAKELVRELAQAKLKF